MPLVTLDVNRVWITLPEDPGGTALVCGSTQQTPVDAPKDGDVRYYAGNRTQAAMRDQEARTLSFTLRHLSPTELNLLLSWRGRVVLLRTMEGERVFCVYANTPYRRDIGTTPDDDPDGQVTFDADVIFFRVSYTEAV